IFRVSAGVDIDAGVATWLMQAIDPATGLLSNNPDHVLLPPGSLTGEGSGLVSFRATVHPDSQTGDAIEPRAVVAIQGSPAIEGVGDAYRVDAEAPTTTLTLETIEAVSGEDAVLRLTWESMEPTGGSGVSHATVYVAEDGGDFRIHQRQVTDTSLDFIATEGTVYEFLVLASDAAGNTEPGRFDAQSTHYAAYPSRPSASDPGRRIDDDPSGTSFGSTPDLGDTTAATPPEVPSTPSTNPLLDQVRQAIPSIVVRPALEASESGYETVFNPFRGEAVALDLPTSGAGIGSLAVLQRSDGVIWFSAGTNRSALYSVDSLGNVSELIQLADPIYDIAETSDGRIWAATGGGPLLELDPVSGAELARFGRQVTQSIEVGIDGATLFVTTASGIDSFHPATNAWDHWSDTRAGSLAVDPASGDLWAASWPNRGRVFRLPTGGKDRRTAPSVPPPTLLKLGRSLDSLAFGKTGTRLEGLLFATTNEGELFLIDPSSRDSVLLADGRLRGDSLATTTDGELLVSQADRLDRLRLDLPPTVIATTPPPGGIIVAPVVQLSVTFSEPMLHESPLDPESITNPLHYQVIGERSGAKAIETIEYDEATRRVTISIPALDADEYTLTVQPTAQSDAGRFLESAYEVDFTAVSDLSSVLDLSLDRPRRNRATGQLHYDVTVTNTGTRNVVVPLAIFLDADSPTSSRPLDAIENPGGGFVLDLAGSVPDGVLAPGESTSLRTITIEEFDERRVRFGHRAVATPTRSDAPLLISRPPAQATVGVTLNHTINAVDPDGTDVAYWLVSGPESMTVDPITGAITWTPTSEDDAETSVHVRMEDEDGSHTEHRFTIQVDGGNFSPTIRRLPSMLEGRELESLRFSAHASDRDLDRLTYYGENLPPGATVDSKTGEFIWTPGSQDAGAYFGVTLHATDGIQTVSTRTDLFIQSSNVPPSIHGRFKASDPPQYFRRTIREGDAFTLAVDGYDPDGDSITYRANFIPTGMTINPTTGLLRWTPTYYQAGSYRIEIIVDDGDKSTNVILPIDVLPANAAPQFQPDQRFEISEGQTLVVPVAADDPDFFASPEVRIGEGNDGSNLQPPRPPLVYEVTGLPDGASFDVDDGLIAWTTDFEDAGVYSVTVTATDDGDGTGSPLATSTTIQLIVNNANGAPLITPFEPISVAVGETVRVPVEAIDVNGELTSLQLVNESNGFPLPEFVTFIDNGDGRGEIIVSPPLHSRGDYPLTLVATDSGDGGLPSDVLEDRYTFNVQVTAPNEPPILRPLIDQLAVVDQPFTMDIIVDDPDSESLVWELTGAPSTAVLEDIGNDRLRRVVWTPSASEVGTYEFVVSATDTGNGGLETPATDRQTFTVTVRADNQAPSLSGPDVVDLAELDLVQFAIVGADPDGDSLQYAAETLPPGASLDPATGQFSWMPTLLQAGIYDVTFSASDGHQAASHTMQLVVANVNQAPRLIDLPVQSLREGRTTEIALEATDLDGDAIIFQGTQPLPSGVFLNSRTGRVRWTPSFQSAGRYELRFSATDPGGLSDVTKRVLEVNNVNRAPELVATDRQLVVGQPSSITLEAFDADSDTIEFLASRLPEGASLSADTGQLIWTPTAGQLGQHVIEFRASDGIDEDAQTVTLHVLAQPQEPTLRLETTPSFPSVPGTTVLLRALADSIAPIAATTITVDGVTLELDARGRGRFVPPAPGEYLVTITATDADGLTSMRSESLFVRDPLDTLAPTIEVTSAPATAIRATQTVTGTIRDASLREWNVWLRSGTSRELIANGAASIQEGEIVAIDPRRFANGFYELEIEATDIGGRVSRDVRDIEINSDAKTRHFESVEVVTVGNGNEVLSIRRVYDSLRSSQLASHVFHPLNVEPQRRGDAVYVSLPGGQRIRYQFTPQPVAGPFGESDYFRPAWTTTTSTPWSLVAGTNPLNREQLLIRVGQRYFDAITGRPYWQPGDESMPSFALIDSNMNRLDYNSRGELRRWTAASGRRWDVTNSAVIGNNGVELRIDRDVSGNLIGLDGGRGQVTRYQYNDEDRLVRSLRLEEDNIESFSYDHRGRLILNVNSDGGDQFVYEPSLSRIAIQTQLGNLAGLDESPRQLRFAGGQSQLAILNLTTQELSSAATGRVIIALRLSSEDASVDSATGTMLAEIRNDGETFLLFAFEQPGPHVLEFSPGDESVQSIDMRLWMAGDVDENDLIDGSDAELIDRVIRGEQTLASVPRADVDGNAVVDQADQSLLASQFGLIASGGPSVVETTTVSTYVGVPVTVDLGPLALSQVATNPSQVLFHIEETVGGLATLINNGTAITFTPSAGFDGTGRVDLTAIDAGGSTTLSVIVDVSSATLVGLSPTIDAESFGAKVMPIGTAIPLRIKARFDDGVAIDLPASVTTIESFNPEIVTVDESGYLFASQEGIATIVVRRGGVTGVLAVGVGDANDLLDPRELQVGSSSLSMIAGSQRSIWAARDPRQPLTAADGLRIISSRPGVVTVDDEAYLQAVEPGSASVFVVDGLTVKTIDVTVLASAQDPSTGVGPDGGIFRTSDGIELG
ncbi:MAG: putative Ig domain-containing protein, partial [Planctomycetota bacterium]